MKKKSIEDSQFYGLKSKKKLRNLLLIGDNESVHSEYQIYRLKDTNRIVEEPKGRTKFLHQRIFKFLKEIETPDYLYSSVKGKSHIDNARTHLKNDYVVSLDLSKFFQKCDSGHVYDFFRNKMKMSEINASLLSEITTIDISKFELNANVKDWFQVVNGQLRYPIPVRHLPTGSCLSQLLAFFSYMDMFDEIYQYCSLKHFTLSVYVDDVVISSKRRISKKSVKYVMYIFSKYGHEVNTSKISSYIKDRPKKVTGIHINKDRQLKAPSKHHFTIKKMRCEFEETRDPNSLKSLIGKIRYVNGIESAHFGNLAKTYEEILKNVKK